MNKLTTAAACLMLLAVGITAQDLAVEPKNAPDNPPQISKPISNLEGTISDQNQVINLSDHFTDPDDAELSLTYEVSFNSRPDVAELTITDQSLVVDLKSAGQTTIIVKATSSELFTTDTFLIGSRPEIEGNFIISTFDESTLDEGAYWNGADESGGFLSGLAYFHNDYNADWFSWSGWAYANATDRETPGFMNQYSAYSAVRLDSSGGKNYGVTYIYGSSEVTVSDEADVPVKGFFVTNSTYATLDMKYGSDYSKKFGGETGEDPDWFKLTIYGYTQGGDSSSVDFMLADFTSEMPAEDHIIETWQWVELTELGPVNRLKFMLSSTDNGDFGMNTPSFFCMDNLYVSSPASSRSTDVSGISVYPNPTDGIVRVRGGGLSISQVKLYDHSGRMMQNIGNFQDSQEIDISGLPGGVYFLEFTDGNKRVVKPVIRK